jgi:hypothetical protein
MSGVTRLLRHVVLSTLLLPAAALAQPQAVAGTRVTLQPPAGWEVADRFPGFMQASSGSSIMITEIPAPAGQMIASFTREALGARGMELRASERQTVDGGPGVLLAISQTAAGTVYDKWMLAFGNDSATVLVTGTYLQERAGELSEPVKQAVLSARRNAAPSADPMAGLGYRIDPGPRLKVATRVGNMILTNETGTLPNPGPGSPMLMVAESLAPGDMSDLAAFSRERVMATAPTIQVSNVTGAAATIAGAQAYEVTADGVDTEDSTRLRIYQAVVREGDHYILVQGIVGADRAAEWFPYFQTVARGLQRTR